MVSFLSNYIAMFKWRQLTCLFSWNCNCKNVLTFELMNDHALIRFVVVRYEAQMTNSIGGRPSLIFIKKGVLISTDVFISIKL